jgi:DNA polymerase-3 subunit delta'
VAVRLIRSGLDNKRLASSLLFVGPRGVGKATLARELAKAIICPHAAPESCDECQACHLVENLAHPDVRLVVPGISSVRDTKKSAITAADKWEMESVGASRNPVIPIGVIRDLREEISRKPYQAPRRAIVLRHAHQMTDEAANALLKILEEPPPTTYLILTTYRAHLLPATIRSRCQRIPFRLLSRTEIEHALRERTGIDENRAHMVAALAQGSLGKALQLIAEEFDTMRQEATDIFLRLPSIDEGERGELLQSWGSVEMIRHVIPLLYLLYQDLLLLKWGGADSSIQNRDFISQLTKRVGDLTLDDLELALSALDEASAALRANVDPRLIVMTALQRLP